MPFLHALVIAVALVCVCRAPVQAPLPGSPVDAGRLTMHGIGVPDPRFDEGSLHADASEKESDRPVLADEKPTDSPMREATLVLPIAASDVRRSTARRPGPAPDVLRERRPPRRHS